MYKYLKSVLKYSTGVNVLSYIPPLDTCTVGLTLFMLGLKQVLFIII